MITLLNKNCDIAYVVAEQFTDTNAFYIFVILNDLMITRLPKNIEDRVGKTDKILDDLFNGEFNIRLNQEDILCLLYLNRHKLIERNSLMFFKLFDIYMFFCLLSLDYPLTDVIIKIGNYRFNNNIFKPLENNNMIHYYFTERTSFFLGLEFKSNIYEEIDYYDLSCIMNVYFNSPSKYTKKKSIIKK